jgi:hypothetical protein
MWSIAKTVDEAEGVQLGSCSLQKMEGLHVAAGENHLQVTTENDHPS